MSLAIIERRWAGRIVTKPGSTAYISEFVFHCDGCRVGDFRKAWRSACIAAGFCHPKAGEGGRAVLDGKGKAVMESSLKFHDFRRSAARNLRRAQGIGPEVGMKITGHETDSMWRRYSIVDEDDIERALTAVQQYVGQQVAGNQDRKVFALSEVRR
jgi:integrase